MVQKSQTALILKLAPGSFFCVYQDISCFSWHEFTAHDEYSSREKRMHLISLLAARS